MAHYKVTEFDLPTLESNYPHSPTDPTLSIAEYLETEFSAGWSLSSLSFQGSNGYFVFTPNAQ